MEELYITFGQVHTHSHNGKTLDKDTVGLIKAETYDKARKLAFEWFGGKFATTYTKEEFEKDNTIKYFPKGVVELN